MQKVIVTGGTGFIGSRLVQKLRDEGYEVTILARGKKSNSDSSIIPIDLEREAPDPVIFEGAEGVIHLAGASIFQRWTKPVKDEIYASRITSTRRIVEAIAQCRNKPKVFISASAVGYYGDAGEAKLDESAPAGHDFLARVCVDWEKEAQKAVDLGVRAVQIRTAPVLGPGGMLGILMPLYRMGLGGSVGSGKQWLSWIHHDDIVASYHYALANKTLHGPVNAGSPEPVRYRDFARALGHALHTPAFFPTPAWLVQLIFGDMASMVTNSQRMIPAKLTQAGFHFTYPDLQAALKTIQK